MSNLVILQKNEKDIVLNYFAIEDIEVISSWLAQKRGGTLRNYRRIVLDLFKRNPRRKMSEFTVTSFVIYFKVREKEGISLSTQKHIRHTLSSLFSFAVKVGHIRINHLLILDKIKVPDRTHSKVLTFEQISRMIEKEQNQRNKLIIKTLYYTGLRVEELSSLMISSFRKMNNSVSITVTGKGSKTRTIGIPDYLYSELLEFWVTDNYKESDPAFKSREEPCKNLSTRQILRIVVSAAKTAKIQPLPSTHFLRHSFATLSLSAGTPIHVLKRDMGHSSISTLSKYLDIAPQESSSSYLKRI